MEQEILDWYKTFGHFLNVVAHTDPAAGKRFFDLEDYTIWDLMGNLKRGNLGPHYDHITPYLGKTNQSFKNVEVVAVTPEFGYITSMQRVHGTATDGSPYDMTFRATTLARKVGPVGEWKLVHEHYSFPVDMATKVADFTSSQELSENVEFQKKL